MTRRRQGAATAGDLRDDSPVHDVSTPPRDTHLPQVRVPSQRAVDTAVVAVASKGRVKVVMRLASRNAVANVVRRVAVAVWPPKGLPHSRASGPLNASTSRPRIIPSKRNTSERHHITVNPTAKVTTLTSVPVTTTAHRLVITTNAAQHTTTITLPTSITIVRPRGRSVLVLPITTVAGHVHINIIAIDVTSDWAPRRSPEVAMHGSGVQGVRNSGMQN